MILAGKEYGTGSSRDWAAKGTMLLGVQGGDRRELRAHSPLQSDRHGRAAAAVQGRPERQSLGLTGQESFEITGFNGVDARSAVVVATPASGSPIRFEVRVRIDTPKELEYFRHGGILHVRAAPARRPEPRRLRRRPSARLEQRQPGGIRSRRHDHAP